MRPRLASAASICVLLTTIDPQGKKTVTRYETGKAYWQEPMPPGAMHKDVNETGKTIELIVVEQK